MRLPLNRTAKHAFLAVALAMVGVLVAVDQHAVAQPNTGAMQDGAPVLLNDGVPRELRDVSVDQKLGAQVPVDAPLIDSMGRKRRLGDYLDGDRPLVLTLNYSNCPMLCNVQLNQLAQSLNESELKIEADFRLLSVSIDPKETDQRLRETKKRYVVQVPSHTRADEGWAFTRTDKATIDRIAESVGFSYRYNSRTKEYAHPAMLAFLSPDGVITRYSLGVAFPPDQMRLALVEAGRGNVGGIVDQFVLWCYSYDPAENSYVPQAWKIMRLGGGLTIMLLAAALLPYWRGRKGAPVALGSGEAAEVEVSDEPHGSPLKATHLLS